MAIAQALGAAVLFRRLGNAGVWRVAVGCALAAQSALLAAPWEPYAPWTVGLAMFLYGGATLGFPAASRLVFDHVAPHEATTAMALLSVSGALAFAAAAPTFAALLDPAARGAAAAAPFALGWVLMAAAAGVFAIVLTPPSRRSSALESANPGGTGGAGGGGEGVLANTKSGCCSLGALWVFKEVKYTVVKPFCKKRLLVKKLWDSFIHDNVVILVSFVLNMQS